MIGLFRAFIILIYAFNVTLWPQGDEQIPEE